MAHGRAFGRRVVTGPGGVADDGPAPLTIEVPGGIAVSEVLWLDGPPRTVDAGPDRTGGGFPLEPPAGGMSARIIRAPATGEWIAVEGDDPTAPGMHATDTLDFVVVVDGEIVLGMADGSETTVRAGEFVVQRGTRHRWRVDGDRACTYFVAMLRPDPAQVAPGPLPLVHGRGARRLVTDGDGVIDGATSGELEASTTRLFDVWHTGGPLVTATQGGDPDGPWTLEPPPGGAWLRALEMAPGPPSEAGWHRTPTIDVDIVLAGRLGLDLPDGASAELGPGDVVVQRGTDHRWRVIGDEPVRFAAVMLALAGASD